MEERELQIKNQSELQERFVTALENSKFEFENYFFANFLNLKFTYEKESCIINCKIENFMLNPRQKLHGGITAFLMDASMGHLCRKYLGSCVTLEMKVQYFEAVTEGTVRCEAVFLKKGKTINYLESKIINDHGLVLAMATATFKKI